MIFIILAIIVVIALWVIATYNNLVSSKVKVDNSFSQIDVQLQRRFDLIPNLVECVKGYMEHESDVLTKVTELRTSWASAGSVSEKVEIDNQLSGALKTIMAVSENYPDLKANQNFNGLQQDLKDTENKISYARQFYNDAVTRYNRNLMVFPSNIIASMFHFTPATLFAVDSAEAKQNVKVDFGK
ncbi:MAG: LemA family protein [Clostridia bacterium]|nr:LemA family protein [Clostridia bacterium]